MKFITLLGKVITANKALLADHGEGIYRTAKEINTGIYYEAAVGGGIPVLRSQRAGLNGNRIESIYGILNGTCNYILTRMERESLPFNTVLADAQALGYCPADNIEKRCYIRLCIDDKLESMAQVMPIFGKHNISIVVQKECHEQGYTSVVILTQKAKEAKFKAAMTVIGALDVSCCEPVRMRLEDLEQEITQPDP